MAIGAVLFSLPTALCIALYGYAAQTLTAPQSLLLYACVGTAIMLTFTIGQALSFTDHR